MGKRYAAYVGSYTYIGNSKGITILDVDAEKGTMTKRKEVRVNNASYVSASRDGTRLYSIADDGIVSYRILPNGDLERMGIATIRGMRGCHISTDAAKHYMFVSGYHDGKVTVLRVNEDGSAGEITDGFYDKGIGSIAERNFRPHISCSRLTPDEKFLCAANLGIDQIKIFRFNKDTGKIKLVDAVRCELESAPRFLRFSNDGKFMYVISELKNYISVYSYDGSTGYPNFELLQTIPTVGKKHSNVNAAAALRFSHDGKLVLCSNAGDNSIGIYDRDETTGLLTQKVVLPISGEYPKDIGMMPGGKHFYSVNHETSTMTFFTLVPEKNYFYMHAAPLRIDQPNCCALVELPEE
ncbi:MAG: lactonase family protein [Lachnospiraceae bacterium]|nr:lactonase family protein [Lachnospiraceae bacterium]